MKGLLMGTLQEIEQAVLKLPHKELARFREWFEEYDATQWDKQLEEDVKSGKLDRVAEKAVADYRKGHRKEL